MKKIILILLLSLTISGNSAIGKEVGIVWNPPNGVCINATQHGNFIQIETTQGRYYLNPNWEISRLKPNGRDEFSTTTMFQIDQGKLMVWNIPKILVAFSGKSVRYNDEYSVATYDGVYINNKRLNYPVYASGKIKRLNNKFFVCFDGISIVSELEEISTIYNEGEGQVEIDGHKLGKARDIALGFENSKLIITDRCIAVVDSSFTRVTDFILDKDIGVGNEIIWKSEAANKLSYQVAFNKKVLLVNINKELIN